MRIAAGWAFVGVLGAGFLTSEAAERRLLGVKLPDAATATVPEAPIDPELLKLVQSLGSENYREREKAGQALEAKGEKSLHDLRRALASTDSPEISRRLTMIVRRMDYDRLVSPKRITMNLKDKTAKAAFDEITKQTGYKIEYANNGPGGIGAPAEPKFNFEFEKAPFWQVVDKIAEQAGLGVYADYDDEIVRVNSHQDVSNPHVCYAGPFRFVATGINSSRNVQLSGISKRGFQQRSSESIGFSFQIHSEPKNPILGTLPAEVTLATDELGGNLVPPKDPNQFRSSYYNQGSYRGHNAYGNVSLLRGSKDATTLKTIKGKMGIVLLAGIVPEVVIADPMKTKMKTIRGRNVEVVFDSMTEAGGQYTATLTVKRLDVQDQNNIDYNWSNSIWQKIELQDATGKKWNTYGPNQINNNNGLSVQLVIPFNKQNRRGEEEKLGPPVKLIVNEWLQVTNDVTFEFKDVPLP
ncbi:MAG: hypothetical protein U0791_04660 [Gemmataceae bacterium]